MTGPIIVDRVIFGADDAVSAWVNSNVPIMVGRPTPNMFSALGVIHQNEIVAGVVYHNYRKQAGDIEVSVAATDPIWCLPDTLRRLFRYPFQQLGVQRITCITSRKNKRCRRLIEGLGWKLEGTHRKAYDGVDDAMSYGMLAHELRIKERDV